MDDPEAWARLFRATLPELYAFVGRRTGGERALAEDVTQETWLRALQAWRSKGIADEPLAWLKTTASNLLKNHYRAARREGSRRTRIDLEELSPAPEEHRDAVALVRAGLARIPEEEATLVEAFHLDGQSARELARELGLSERAIEGRLHRARRRLRRVFSRRSDEPS